MAEDHSQRRSNETIARTGQARTEGTDPLAELARLIGQSDPFGDAMHASARLAESAGAPPAVDWTVHSAHGQAEQFSTRSDFTAQPAAPELRTAAGAQSFAHPASGQTYMQAPAGELPQVQQEIPSYLAARAAANTDYYSSDTHPAEQYDVYDDLPPARRRLRVLAVVAVFGLAVIGTAGAFGYRTVFGSTGSRVPPVIAADKAPLKIVPNSARSDDKKAIVDRVSDPAEKVVSREERPIDIGQKLAEVSAQTAAQPSTPAPPMGNGVLASEPKKVHTIPIRPDGSDAQAMASPMPPQPATPPLAASQQPSRSASNSAPAAGAMPPAPAPAPFPSASPSSPWPPSTQNEATSKPQTPQPLGSRAQAASSAPLSLNPNTEPPPRAPVRTANAAASAGAPVHAAASAKVGGYAVQVSSQRSEDEAKAAYRSLQAKYPQQLGSKPMFVHKVDLGAKGVYYRTMVGPFASASEAAGLCSGLKSAGGSCIVQKN